MIFTMSKLADYIGKIADLLYIGPFKIVPPTTFRYGIVGGANVLFGIVEYWFIYNYILFQKDIDLGLIVISAPIFAFLLNFVITFFTGFWLMRNVAFSSGKLSTYRQIIRYGLVVGINILVNYFGLKILISSGVFPSISNAVIQPVTIAISYFLNSRFTFK